MKKLTGNALTRDSNFIAIPVANAFVAMDATGTPNKSPLTVSSTPIAIIPPAGSIKVVLKPIAADCRVSDEATDADHYFTIKLGDTLTLDCANEKIFYVMRDASTDVTLNFLFLYI